MKIEPIMRVVYVIAIVALIWFFGWVVGINDGKASVESIYDSPQPIRVTQKTLKEAGYYDGPIDGIAGRGTMAGWRQWDRVNVGFVEERWADND